MSRPSQISKVQVPPLVKGFILQAAFVLGLNVQQLAVEKNIQLIVLNERTKAFDNLISYLNIDNS